ncbi:MAG TPA: tetratricopeptide repeat protein [Thermoanaerobaculia bacterium]|nr:tetratricopeptide repeat protein [Thermoanaerobaculia bacterium]
MSENGRVVIVQAPATRLRREILCDYLAEAERRGSRTWLLDTGFDAGGPWAGIHDLFAGILEEMREQRPDLVEKHDYELIHVLPELRRSLRVRYSTLTDLAAPEERVRNFPADRAFRIVHGLIELLDAWKGDAGPAWVIACDSFDQISHIGRRFFRELMRRRGERLGLTLLVACAPASSDEVRDRFPSEILAPVIPLELPGEEDETRPSPSEALRLAQELESRAGEDLLEIQIHLPDLLRAWRAAGDPKRLFLYNYRGLEIFNTLGLYEDAIVYGEAARALYKEHIAERPELRWSIFLKLFMSYLGLLNPEQAERLATEDAIGRIENLEWRGQLHYLLAMLYARFSPQRDFARGEELLELGMRDLEQAGMDESARQFQMVFNRNGLAMIRHFQGRFQEAIDLCREGFDRLNAHLSPDRHRLHRSVLLYNVAQVCSALGEHEEAIRHYSAAMEMDPHYSEYFNERGNIFLRLGREEEARDDYLTAIELSPPYFEVWTNLGQCYRRLGRMQEAVDAYSRALDLEPDQLLARLGRAQAHEALGRPHEAIADYDAALALNPNQWDAVASRAVLQYETGDLAASLGDLNRAIELAPQVADLRQNRALVFLDLGCLDEAAHDLAAYLDLEPDAEDRAEVEERLRLLGESLRATA